MKKLLFLDIDGVLNSTDWFKRKKKLPPESSRKEFMAEMLDPTAIEILRNILTATDCDVVLSSSWRGSDENHALLREYVCNFIDITPRCCSGVRGVEIYNWISKNIPYDVRDEVRYAIVDDDSDMLLNQKDNFFQTRNDTGLTTEIAKSIIEHLNK